MPPQSKKKSSIGSVIFFTVAMFSIYHLYRGIFDETYSGGKAFSSIAFMVVGGFAIYAISTAFEHSTDKNR